MAPDRTEIEEDWPVPVARPCKCFIAPWVPFDRLALCAEASRLLHDIPKRNGACAPSRKLSHDDRQLVLMHMGAGLDVDTVRQ